MSSEEFSRRLQNAFISYGRSLMEKSTNDAQEFMDRMSASSPSNQDVLMVAERLDSPGDKFLLLISYANIRRDKQFKDDNKKLLQIVKDAAPAQGKRLYDQLPYFDVGAAKFIADQSPEDYRAYARKHPFEYKIYKGILKGEGLDTNYTPSHEDYMEAFRADRYRASGVSLLQNYIDELKDRPIPIEMLAAMAQESTSAYYILRKYKDVVKDSPQGDAIMKDAIRTDIDDLKRILKKGGFIDYRIEQLLKMERYETDIEPLLRKAAKEFPPIGLTAFSYSPHVPGTKVLYKESLPQAHKFLNEPGMEFALIKIMNELHDRPDAERFEIVKNVDAAQLYDLISKQREHHYTSTYNGLMNRFIERMKTEGKSFSEIADSSPERIKNIPVFAEAATSFNRFGDLLKNITLADQYMIAENLLQKKDGAGYDISSAALFVKALPEKSPIPSFLEKTIVEKFNSGTQQDKIDIGLLAHWYAKFSGHVPSKDQAEFFDKMAGDTRFAIPPVVATSSSELLDTEKRNYQLHVFFNDEDGVSSFQSFSKAMKADGWKFIKKNDFLIVSKEQEGRSIKMLISPPEQDGDAIEDIKKYVRDQDGKISVLLHRGHSYHVDKTLAAVDPDNKIVFLGSCGGYNNVSSVLDKSPEANILSTSGMGRAVINNATLLWMNREILSGRDVQWNGLNAVWAKLGRNPSLEADADSYVSPNENLMLMFERRKRELYEEPAPAARDAEPEPNSGTLPQRRFAAPEATAPLGL